MLQPAVVIWEKACPDQWKGDGEAASAGTAMPSEIKTKLETWLAGVYHFLYIVTFINANLFYLTCYPLLYLLLTGIVLTLCCTDNCMKRMETYSHALLCRTKVPECVRKEYVHFLMSVCQLLLSALSWARVLKTMPC